MARKGFGKFVAFAAVTGAVAAGVSYVLQYKTFHRELEKDFREFEEGDEEDLQEKDDDRTIDPRKLNRNYISLTSSKDEFKVAAKDMAVATKNVLKDAGSLLSDTAHEAMSAAVDTAHMAINTAKAKKDEFMAAREKNMEESEEDSDPDEDEGFLDDDYVDDDDLYDYERMEGGSTYAGRGFRTADSSRDDYSDDILDDPAPKKAETPAGDETSAPEEAAADSEKAAAEEAPTAEERPEETAPKETATIEEDTIL
ncbi:MAG: hypothetical protein ACI4F3_10145 [Enterocloster sp.]